MPYAAVEHVPQQLRYLKKKAEVKISSVNIFSFHTVRTWRLSLNLLISGIP